MSILMLPSPQGHVLRPPLLREGSPLYPFPCGFSLLGSIYYRYSLCIFSVTFSFKIPLYLSSFQSSRWVWKFHTNVKISF